MDLERNLYPRGGLGGHPHYTTAGPPHSRFSVLLVLFHAPSGPSTLSHRPDPGPSGETPPLSMSSSPLTPSLSWGPLGPFSPGPSPLSFTFPGPHLVDVDFFSTLRSQPLPPVLPLSPATVSACTPGLEHPGTFGPTPESEVSHSTLGDSRNSSLTQSCPDRPTSHL